MAERKESLKEIHKKMIQNPELSEEDHAVAFNHLEGVNAEGETILKVNEYGFAVEKINKEAYADDYAGYWAIHAGKLWMITGLCLLYLSFKLFGA